MPPYAVDGAAVPQLLQGKPGTTQFSTSFSKQTLQRTPGRPCGHAIVSTIPYSSKNTDFRTHRNFGNVFVDARNNWQARTLRARQHEITVPGNWLAIGLDRGDHGD